MGMVEERLRSLGITLPAGPVPAADYLPWLISGSLLFIAGQIAREGNEFICGQIASELELDRARYAARACGLSILAQAREACAGDLDKIARVIRIGGFINATPSFTQHASVMDGCSQLMTAAFQDNGRHVRAAVGCSSLPRGVLVEADAIFELHN